MENLARTFQLPRRQRVQVSPGNCNRCPPFRITHHDGTSATNKLHLEHDYLIRNWKEAGLDKASIARVDRIVEIPPGYLGTAGYIGTLSKNDIAAITIILNKIVSE